MNYIYPCAVCRNKNKTTEYDLLKHIDNTVLKVPVTGVTRKFYLEARFEWNLNIRCRYGITCPELNDYRQRCVVLARSLEEKMVAVAVNGNNVQFHTLLILLQGYFPGAYRELERIRAISKREISA